MVVIDEYDKIYECDFFIQKFTNLIENSKMKQKIEKKFFVSEIIAYELVSLNCLY